MPDPRPRLERLLGPEGVGRDPGGLARAFPDTAESLAEVMALVTAEGWKARIEGRGSWLAADAPAIIALATAEHLDAHANSVRVRVQSA